jgi:hypothetical protein
MGQRILLTLALWGLLWPWTVRQACAQDLEQRLKPADEVTITLRDGSTRRGIVESVSASTLRLAIDGQPRTVDLGALQTIRKRGDSVVNGTLIGFGIGMGGSLLFGSYATGMCRNENGINCPSLVPTAWLFPVLSGTALGFLIDGSRVGSTVVWKSESRIAVTPSVSPGTVGVQARISF